MEVLSKAEWTVGSPLELGLDPYCKLLFSSCSHECTGGSHRSLRGGEGINVLLLNPG